MRNRLMLSSMALSLVLSLSGCTLHGETRPTVMEISEPTENVLDSDRTARAVSDRAGKAGSDADTLALPSGKSGQCTFSLEDPKASAQSERDHLYSLLAMSVVRHDWQWPEESRGHNIGSVLVKNATGEVVYYARNSNRVLTNGSQHGEVRLVTNFLKCEGEGSYLKDYTLYTTLEPCIMCAGMLTMTQVSRVVYVQKDPSYGDTQEAIVMAGYPICYPEASVNSTFKHRLEADFEHWQERTGNKSITQWLLGDSAKAVYIEAEDKLNAYLSGQEALLFTENALVLEKISDFLFIKDEAGRVIGKNVLSEHFGEEMAVQCPTGKFKAEH